MYDKRFVNIIVFFILIMCYILKSLFVTTFNASLSFLIWLLLFVLVFPYLPFLITIVYPTVVEDIVKFNMIVVKELYAEAIIQEYTL